jgi:hypothetical protein
MMPPEGNVMVRPVALAGFSGDSRHCPLDYPAGCSACSACCGMRIDFDEIAEEGEYETD